MGELNPNLTNFETKVIGNKNLDKEYIESILDVTVELSEKDLANYVIKELFSTGCGIFSKITNLSTSLILFS